MMSRNLSAQFQLLILVSVMGLGFTPIAGSTEIALPAAAMSLQVAQTIPIDARLEQNGIAPQAAKDFVAKMRSAANKTDRSALVALVRFPFTTYDNGRPKVTYHRPQELLRDFNWVFTAKVLKAMRQAEYSRLFVNAQGAMIGNGEVWFDQRPDGVKIKAINE
jgi:hypothetical protein